MTISGDQLKAWRVVHGLSQSDLAARLGVSYKQVGRWERGEDSRGQPLDIPQTVQLALRYLGYPDSLIEK